MRIIAFVGSPVEDNEKDVSPCGSWAVGWEVLGRGPAASSELAEAGGSSLGGKEDVRSSVFYWGTWGGQQSSVCFCAGVTSPHGAGRRSSCVSPSSQLVKLAKRLKKEKVNVDIINFGEEVSKD